MSTLALPPAPRVSVAPEPLVLPLEELGELAPVGRPGGQGRVYRPAQLPVGSFGDSPVVKLYRHHPSWPAARLLAEMITWSAGLDSSQRAHLHQVAAWPLAVVTRGGEPAGIAMRDVSGRFEVPVVMPSGRYDRLLLSLEHLLGADDYLQLRGLEVRLDTSMRAVVAERVSGALAFLHRHGIVASDIAPNNLLVGFAAGQPEVCFIDCDSMVFHGRQALPQVETSDWQIPPGYSEPPQTRAADAYKLGLMVLRLFARSHDARALPPQVRHVPAELRELLARSLSPHAANRPPAGEWQRGLRQALAHGGLNERYPGPRPASAVRRSSVSSPARAGDAPVRRAPAGVSPARQVAPRRGGYQPLSLAWLAVAAVIFAFLLARLMAAANTSPANGFAPGASGAGQQGQYYYAPPGSGSSSSSGGGFGLGSP